ncbi:thioredoxin family protein [Candidatus Daviesbacteria bacterium]|nr:thioredoxin family protein [Candidatus Daviesbacteria bacterium]
MSGKNIYILVTVIAVLILGGVLFASTRNSSNNQQTAQNTQQATVNNQGVQGVGEENTQNQDSSLSQRFVAYSEENLKKATENNGKAVVFFHAGWCPMCAAAEKELKEKWGEVPQDVTILKTDYDTSSELKAKYGITMQDTWVQVDREGKEITKWNSGGEGLKTLLANLK